MAFTVEQQQKAFDRTGGQCHICHKNLAWKNYGKVGARMAWEIDHSIPKAKGGTDHGNNLYAACIRCNRSKQDKSTRSARALHGKTKAPLSAERREQSSRSNTLAGASVGGLAGALFGPAGALIGVGLGALIWHDADPEE